MNLSFGEPLAACMHLIGTTRPTGSYDTASYDNFPVDR